MHKLIKAAVRNSSGSFKIVQVEEKPEALLSRPRSKNLFGDHSQENKHVLATRNDVGAVACGSTRRVEHKTEIGCEGRTIGTATTKFLHAKEKWLIWKKKKSHGMTFAQGSPSHGQRRGPSHGASPLHLLQYCLYDSFNNVEIET